MRTLLSTLIILIVLSPGHCRELQGSDPPPAGMQPVSGGVAVKSGRIESNLVVECSGIDASGIRADMLWAVNDSGDGPYLYALGMDGSDLGRVRIAGAVNRDWEDLATFAWRDRAMIAVADIGDNRARHGTYRIYVVEEPRLVGMRFDPSTAVTVSWIVTFRYPDRSHDAEAAAVDVASGQILILTKRDRPPLLFGVSIEPEAADKPRVARRIGAIDRIPPPTIDDRLYPYGEFRAQPTAMDLSPEGLKMIVLTYKDAYLFIRTAAGEAWTTVSDTRPIPIPLPLPQNTPGFGQREAACFSADAGRLHVTSEGRHAGIYRIDLEWVR